MATQSVELSGPAEDPVSNVLKWVLLAVAVTCFAILAYTTKLTYEAAPPLPDRMTTAERRGRHDVGRHRRRQGRLPARRPDGLRQPVRHGLVLRRGLHRRQPRARRAADRGQHRDRARRPAAGGAERRRPGLGQGRDAEDAAGRRPERARHDHPRSARPGDRDAPRADRPVPAAPRLHDRMDPGLQPGPDERGEDGRLPALLLADDGRAPAGQQRVLDAELAVRAARRQHPDDQHLPLDLDQLLLHLLRLRRRDLHLRALPQRGARAGADGSRCSARSDL